MDWQDERDELYRRQALAEKLGGEDKIERQHKGGRLTVRERIDQILDTDSFQEIGGLAGAYEYDDKGNITSHSPTNCVMGRGGSAAGRREHPGRVALDSPARAHAPAP